MILKREGPRRVEERVCSLRQSLDQSYSRGHSATGYLARILSGTPSAATERLREYVAEIEDDSEEEERVGGRNVLRELEPRKISYIP